MKIDNSKALTLEVQNAISPQKALEMLKEGNSRFLNNQPLSRDYNQQVNQTSGGQFPFATILSCIDSRVPTEIVFDQGIGDLFNAKIAGNFVNDDILGSMEFASKLAGSKLILVLGHTACGAVKGACDQAELGNLTQMLKKIKPAVDAVTTEPGTDRTSKNAVFVNDVARENVYQTINNVKNGSEVLKEMHEKGEIDIVGGMYDVASGKVTFFS